MRAVLCRALGDPTKPRDAGGALAVENVPSPRCPRDGVKVKVEAAALNFADLLMVKGEYQEKPRLPFIPGGEFAGVVTECGANVRSGVKIGDRVAGVTMGGGAMAEETVANAASVFPVPDGVTLEQAAAFPVAFGTAHLALTRYARVTKGSTVLILGAAGGVGLAAVQIAKALGCVVVAAANGVRKMDALRDAGADHCIDASLLHSADGGGIRAGRRDDYAGLKRAVARALNDGDGLKSLKSFKGVDVLLDPVGGDGFTQGLRCVRWGGKVMVLGFASGIVPKLPLNLPLVKNIAVHGVYWGAHADKDPKSMRESLADALGMLADGRCVVKVSDTFGMDDAYAGFKTLAERRAVGKVVVAPGLVVGRSRL